MGLLWAIGIAAGVLPAIGPVIAGGIWDRSWPAGVGAAVGGLTGALIGMGIPEEEAHYYENEFRSGRTIVTVKADGRLDEVTRLFRRFGAYDAAKRHAAASEVNEQRQTVQLREEELRARKQEAKVGEVRVRKDVHTEHKTFDVPVSKEEVVIERHPVSGQGVPRPRSTKERKSACPCAKKRSTLKSSRSSQKRSKWASEKSPGPKRFPARSARRTYGSKRKARRRLTKKVADHPSRFNSRRGRRRSRLFF